MSDLTEQLKDGLPPSDETTMQVIAEVEALERERDAALARVQDLEEELQSTLGTMGSLQRSWGEELAEARAAQDAAETDNERLRKLLAEARAALGTFRVLDVKTGETYDAKSDLSKLALRLREEQPDCNLIYCDMETLALGMNGLLYAIDECGNVAYLDDNFAVVAGHCQPEAEEAPDA